MLGITPSVLVVSPSLRAISVQEVIALAKANPGKLNVGAPGLGTAVHLASELFNFMAGIKMVQVPYKGPPEALSDIVAGRVDLMFPTITAALPFVKSGKLKILAVTSARRHPSIPDVPTIGEAGLPGYEVIAWYGMVAPASTPNAIITQINGLLGKILETSEVKQRLYNVGVDIAPSTPEQFGVHIREETAKWRKIIKTVGIKVD